MSEIDEMDEAARAILRANDRGGYTIPTEGLYPYQWNWDSVFAALGFATFDPDRAWSEIETLFEAQWPDGMVPHIVFRVDAPSYFPGPKVWGAETIGPIPSSGITQPPVAASAVMRMVDGAPDRAKALLPGLEAWHLWFHAARDPDDLGVIAVTHPWESGRDNLPDWDAPGDAIDVSKVGEYTRRDTSLVDGSMRPTKKDYDRYLALVQFGKERGWVRDRIAKETPFFVADPGMSAILLRAERDLAGLQDRFGVDATATRLRIAKLEAGFDRLWNESERAYCALDLRTGRMAPKATAAAFLAFWAGVDRREDALLETLERFGRGRRLVASYDPDDAAFDPVRYWRGPVWAMINYMIGEGLAEMGEARVAARIRADTAELMRSGGFAEYFDPITGRGCGGGTFSWTAAIWLAWRLSEVERAA